MSEPHRALLLALKAALDAALALPSLSEPVRRQLCGASRALARELWPRQDDRRAA